MAQKVCIFALDLLIVIFGLILRVIKYLLKNSSVLSMNESATFQKTFRNRLFFLLGLFQRLLSLFALGDVPNALAVSQRIAFVVVYRLPGHRRPDYLTILAHDPELGIIARTAFKCRAKGFEHPVTVFFTNDRPWIIRHGHYLFNAVAGDTFYCRIRPQNPAIRAYPDLPAVSVVCDCTEALVGHLSY